MFKVLILMCTLEYGCQQLTESNGARYEDHEVCMERAHNKYNQISVQLAKMQWTITDSDVLCVGGVNNAGNSRLF